MSGRRYRVALAGYYGFGNLGDELLAQASLETLLRCGVERERVVVLSADPKATCRALRVESVSRWSFWDVLRTLVRSDTLLLGGGGLFQDVTSLRSCAWYWGLTRLARLCGATPWVLGQSLGPLNTRLGRALTQDALRGCRVVHVRDARSLKMCRDMKLPAYQGEDLVFSLAEAFTAEQQTEVSSSKEVLLVNLRPSPQMESFAEAACAVAGAFPGEVVGTALSEEDEVLLQGLIREGWLKCTRLERLTTLEDAAWLFPGAKAAIGMRLHFLVLAALAEVPVAALPYDPKVEAFAEGFGLPPWRAGAEPSFGLARLPDLKRIRDELDAVCLRVFDSNFAQTKKRTTNKHE
ncbi:MAG: polysaccharide pyruvyl transferase CsaB [Fretibacterium sp.]|nr:polysaccharide pyruvyl transferase CsaB [Fretibacterium sp.]